MANFSELGLATTPVFYSPLVFEDALATLVSSLRRVQPAVRSGTIKLLRYEAHLTGGSIAMDELERLLWQRKREYVPPPLNINLGWRTGDRMVVDGPNENVPGLN